MVGAAALMTDVLRSLCERMSHHNMMVAMKDALCVDATARALSSPKQLVTLDILGPEMYWAKGRARRAVLNDLPLASALRGTVAYRGDGEGMAYQTVWVWLLLRLAYQRCL